LKHTKRSWSRLIFLCRVYTGYLQGVEAPWTWTWPLISI